MKKLLLSITAMFAFGFINAQIYSATDSTHFAAWTTYDADGDTQNWQIFDFTGTANPFFTGTGAGVMLSNSWVTAGPLMPDNIAISPAINCSANTSVHLGWKAGSIETTASGYHEEHYAVYVVTNPAAILTGTFPTPIWEGTLTDGGIMLSNNINISSVAGGQATVYLVYRHFQCTDENFLALDEVTVSTTAGIETATIEAAVYPNPTNAILNVKTSGEATNITIISMDGKVVATSAINGFTGTVNVAELVNGVYFYEVAAADGSVVRNTFVKN